MLASTMQHSTHNHTPTHHNHHHTHTLTCTPGCVRRSRPGAARKNTNRCLLRTQQCAEPPRQCPGTTMNRSLCSTQPHPPPTSGRAWNQGKGEPTPAPTSQHTAGGLRAGQPHHTVRLLRKEVIQPHLPVRLPCYDFVPIASPTFDNSLPQAG
jgi:hypothetical protein